MKKSQNLNLKLIIGIAIILGFLVFSVIVLVYMDNKKSTVDTRAEVSWNHLSSSDGEIPSPLGSTSQVGSLILDVNKDDLNDFIIASRDAPKSVVWYQRKASGWDQIVIESDNLSLEAGGDFFDIDNDGDLDISFAGDNGSNKIYWWENPYPNYTPNTDWNVFTIKNSGSNKHHDQIFGDVDGDGATELVFWNQKGQNPGLYVAEIPEDPKAVNEWPMTKIFNGTDKHEGLTLVDIDLDQKLDIVGAGLWFKHNGGTDYTPNTIDQTRAFSRVAAGQFKDGGRPEVVFSAGDQPGTADIYSWDGTRWNKTKLFDVVNGHSLQALNIDSNGTLDLFSAEMRLNGENPQAKVRTLYGDGNGGFQTSIVSTGIGVHEGKMEDLDGDGDMDILGKPYNWETPRVDVWLQEGGTTTTVTPTVSVGSLDSWQRYLIAENVDRKMLGVTALDMNNDQKKDIIAGSNWWRQPNSLDGTWEIQNLPAGMDNYIGNEKINTDDSVYDLLGTRGTTHNTHDLLWAKSSGGTYSLLDNITDPTEGDFVQGLVKLNVGTDSYLAISWHRPTDHKLQFYKITGESGNWPLSTQNGIISQNEDLSVGDIDGDADFDIFQGTKWVRNNGSISNWTQHVADNSLAQLDADAVPDRNVVGDFDDDGNLDAIVGLEKGTKILFYKNPGGLNSDPNKLWVRQEIYTIPGEGFSMDSGDIDHDGDDDIVLGEHRGTGNNRVIILENVNKASSWNPHVIDSGATTLIDHHMGTELNDIDGDDDLDIISIGWTNQKVWLYENTSEGEIVNTPTATVVPSHTPLVTSSPTVVPTPGNSTIPSPIPSPILSVTPTSSSGIACGKADMDNNLKFGLSDFVGFAEVYQKNCSDSTADFGECGGKDVDRSGKIEILDFVSFAARYGPDRSCRI